MTGYRVQLRDGGVFLSDVSHFSVSKEGELYLCHEGKDTAVFNRNEWVVMFKDDITKVINQLPPEVKDNET